MLWQDQVPLAQVQWADWLQLMTQGETLTIPVVVFLPPTQRKSMAQQQVLVTLAPVSRFLVVKEPMAQHQISLAGALLRLMDRYQGQEVVDPARQLAYCAKQ